MILGTTQYPSRYSGLGPGVKRGLEFLAAQKDLNALPLGRHALEGDDVFFTVTEMMTVPPSQALFEAHRSYLDIHITLSGEEWFGHALISSLEEVEPYSVEKDVAFYKGEGVYLQAPKGHFALFMPDDAHKPSVSFQTPGLIRKLVLKVRL